MRGVLALDQGSHASRACVFDQQGELRASVQLAIATQRDNEGHIEHDADELGASLQRVATQALAQVPELEVGAAGLATQRSTIACHDRGTGDALAPVISWQDRRSASWLAQFEPHAARVRAITGLPLSAHYGASKLRWCLDQLPAVRDAARRGQLCAGPLAAFLVTRLTGTAPRCDPANASRTLLWDAALLDWSQELLTLFGIDRAVLPDCSMTQAGFGPLDCGRSHVQLVAMTGDQSAVPFAFGNPDPSTAYVNLGTGAFIQTPLRTRPADPAPLLGSVLLAGAGGTVYSLEGTVNGAGSAIEWFASRSGVDESELWPLLLKLSDDAPLPLFVNGIGGLGSPWWRAGQSTYFIGDGDLAMRFAALLESVVFMVAANFECMLALGARPASVMITGGMSRSDWLCSRLAAALEVPVRRMSTEASARGVAALADPELASAWQPPQGQAFVPHLLPGLRQRQQRFRREVG